MKYRAVWIDKHNHIQLGVLTDYQTAKEEAEFKTALELSTWVENEEHEKIEE